MTNMAYCRFHNTVIDLQDCLDSIINQDELSKEEKQKRDELIELCEELLEEVNQLKSMNKF